MNIFTENEKMMMTKFKRGLKEYDMELTDLDNFKYYGGDSGSHFNYLVKTLKLSEDEMNYLFHNRVEECICGHTIKQNCYITDGERILILGNCCIKRFVGKCCRTCEICENPHKNRIVNRCNDCRIGICDKCNKPCDKYYKLCRDCYYKR